LSIFDRRCILGWIQEPCILISLVGLYIMSLDGAIWLYVLSLWILNDWWLMAERWWFLNSLVKEAVSELFSTPRAMSLPNFCSLDLLVAARVAKADAEPCEVFRKTVASAPVS
jgi:hypothetical protein